jgi:hypothetical protein
MDAETTALAQNALETAIELGTPSTTAKARLALARCYRAEGRFEVAARELDDALETAGKLEALPLCCLIHAERGKLVTLRAETDAEAETYLTDALELAEQSGAALLERHCREAFAPGVETA